MKWRGRRGIKQMKHCRTMSSSRSLLASTAPLGIFTCGFSFQCIAPFLLHRTNMRFKNCNTMAINYALFRIFQHFSLFSNISLFENYRKLMKSPCCLSVCLFICAHICLNSQNSEYLSQKRRPLLDASCYVLFVFCDESRQLHLMGKNSSTVRNKSVISVPSCRPSALISATSNIK